MGRLRRIFGDPLSAYRPTLLSPWTRSGRLPVVAETVATQAISEPESEVLPGTSGAAGGRGRALVVDDDAIIRRLLSHWLAKAGFDALCAANGEQALLMAREHSPDVVVTDVRMAGMDGLELTRHLRGDAQTAGIPVILVTGLTSLEHRLEGLQAGADEFLSKPVDRGELLARVQTMVRLCRYQQQLTLRTEAYGAEAVPVIEYGALDATDVLLVEDDPAQARVICDTLRPHVRTIRTVGTAREARSQLASHSADVILVDVNLPDTNGMEVVRWAKRLDRLPHVQMALITSGTDPETRVLGLQSGADDFMLKPIPAAELLARVTTMSRNKRLLDALAAQCAAAQDDSTLDEPTGLHARNYFDRVLALELHRSLRHRYEVATLIVDLDDFHRHHQNGGQAVADAVVKHMARTLQSCVRETDLIARFCTEQFALILPYTDLSGAQLVAERIKQRLQSVPFIPRGAFEPLHLTVSIGGALAGAGVEGPAALLSAAEAAVARVKSAGQDGIQIQPAPPAPVLH
ncbi:MAG: two-component system cell cycle response regulator [Myxococcota bacterium]|jgi:two-component system cell cycle response regulator